MHSIIHLVAIRAFYSLGTLNGFRETDISPPTIQLQFPVSQRYGLAKRNEALDVILNTMSRTVDPRELGMWAGKSNITSQGWLSFGDPYARNC